MVDFHSHVLPGIDDGSKSVEESLSLLSMLSSQGVDLVAATPHMDFRERSVESFLEARAESSARLSESACEGSPEILLGAEVEYFQGISRISALSELCIGESGMLLIEMPPERWSDYTVKELTELTFVSGMTPVIAHVERYMDFQKTKVLQNLIEYGIIMQVNASFFCDLRTRRRALKLLRKKMVHVIGSDCHNVKHRPPRLADAIGIISDKLGVDFVKSMDAFARDVIGRKKLG